MTKTVQYMHRVLNPIIYPGLVATHELAICAHKFHSNMCHVFDGAKLFILNTRCMLSATHLLNFMLLPDPCVKFEHRVADGNECLKLKILPRQRHGAYYGERVYCCAHAQLTCATKLPHCLE